MPVLRFIALLFLFTGVLTAQLVRRANTSLDLPAELPTATGYDTENALGNLRFSSPIDVASPPGVTNHLFVIERGSGIQLVDLDNMTKRTFLGLASHLSSRGRPLQTNSENGILSLAFHPNYNQNGYFYVFYSISINGQLYQRVGRFQATGVAGRYNHATTANPNTESPLITQRDQAGNHNGGDMEFGPDGYLYISTGDEGPQRDGADNARHIAKDFLGGIMRIDVDRKPGSLPPNPHDESSTGTRGDSAITPNSYAIPPDNPFVALAQGSGTARYNGFTVRKNSIRTEWFAIGFRNPWRMSFDPHTGQLFVADVGQNGYEEINIVTSGFNGGWSWREGLHSHNPAVSPFTAPNDFLGQDPIFEYDRSNNGNGNDRIIHGRSVTGGVVYRSDRLPELFGKYVFADYQSGRIAVISEQPNGRWTGEQIAQDSNICGFGYDPRNGDALLCDLSAGEVRRLVRTGLRGTPPPAKLSETGAFSDLATLTPTPGLIPYEPNVSFWSDHATKKRWFAIRNNQDRVGFHATDNWTLPTGMVWVKHFDIEAEPGNPASRRKLETRFLVKTQNEVYGLSYRWRADESDADLVPEQGRTELIAGSTQSWRYPSRSDCRTCHTEVGGFALSFNARQLNHSHEYGGQLQNQLKALHEAGYLSGPAPDPISTPALAPANDLTASVEWRVRSYLDANCAQCHQPNGAVTGHWDARANTPTDLAQLIMGRLVNDGGDPDNRWCVPGDPDRSMVLLRLSGAGGPRMPPVGSFIRDLENDTLIREWILNHLPNRTSFAQWQANHFDDPESAEARPDADPDNDRSNNAQEYLRGTDPHLWSLPAALSGTTEGNQFSLTFDQPANRSALIEVSSDLKTWAPWRVPDNRLLFPASNTRRTVTGERSSSHLYFRLRYAQP